MMKLECTGVLFVLALAAGCDQGAPGVEGPRNPGVAPAATVTLTSVTFADDCGGTPPSQAPAMPAARRAPSAADRAAPAAMAPPSEEAISDTPADRRCEQTSMQLAIAAKQDTQIDVKSVEVFDDNGASVGVLASRSPTRWSEQNAAYEPWDGTLTAGQTANVSYVLQQPAFVGQYEERDRTYTVKVIASVGGIDQPLQTSVMVVGRPAPVPT